VSGFDDTLIAEAMGLTSVRQPVSLLAAAAMSSVFDAGLTTPQAELDATVVFRNSTA